MDTDTLTKPLLACGCVASATLTRRNGTLVDPPLPSCPIHNCTEVAANVPDLAGRAARCACGKTRPSSFGLAFFEYRGPASMSATEICICGYYRTAHEKRQAEPTKYRHLDVGMKKCGGSFMPRGDIDFDSYYCGHGGWD